MKLLTQEFRVKLVARNKSDFDKYLVIAGIIAPMHRITHMTFKIRMEILEYV